MQRHKGGRGRRMDKKCSNLKEILFQRIPGDLVSELWKRHGTWKRWILFQALPTVHQSPFYCQEYIFRIINNSGMAFYWPNGKGLKFYGRFIWQKEKVVKKRVPCILIWVRMQSTDEYRWSKLRLWELFNCAFMQGLGSECEARTP